MSTVSRWTLIGMRAYDPSLFDTLELPEGYDKQTFVDALLLEHGEKCVLYTDPEFMKYSIGIWSRKWSLELSRIYEALTAEYNPLYNYDRFEEISDGETRSYSRHENGTRNATDKPDYTNTQTNNNTDTTTNANTDTRTNNNVDSERSSNTQTTDAKRDRVTEHTISADNSSGYSPEWKETTNDGKTEQTNSGNATTTHTGTITDAHTGTITDTHTGTITNKLAGTTQNVAESDARTIGDNETRSNTHTAHIFGNVGVTTSTKMIDEIIAQRVDKNLYDITTRLFANELLIPIY